MSKPYYIEAGALVRRPIRRYLLSQDVQFTEEKGLLNSIFYLNVTPQQYSIIAKTLNDWLGEQL